LAGGFLALFGFLNGASADIMEGGAIARLNELLYKIKQNKED